MIKRIIKNALITTVGLCKIAEIDICQEHRVCYCKIIYTFN